MRMASMNAMYQNVFICIDHSVNRYKIVMITGPTGIMHFCRLPSAGAAVPVKTDAVMDRAEILYGKDEFRLYEAALTIVQEIC